MQRVFCKWFSIIYFVVNVHCNTPTTVRRTTNGPIEGIELISSLKQPYYAFKGVRFAEAPITGADPLTGQQVDRRFKMPKPLQHTWHTPVKANRFGKGCMQLPSYFSDPFYLSEDCLFLNIYVPLGGSQRKPVLIWFHGGSFIFGDGSDRFFGPDFLLARDNVIVTIQYRLGIFGFLSLGTGAYTGNMGLKDQQLGLKWVWENIEHFSGDKQQILIFGQSVGGGSVHWHLLNKESRQYFNRAFVISNSAVFGWRRKSHLKAVEECSKTNGTNQLVEFLKTANRQSLLNCHSDIRETGIWAPIIESPQTRGAFLTQTPDEIYKSNRTLAMDTMFSFTSQEGLLINPKFAESTEPLIKEDWRETNSPIPEEFPITKKDFPKEYKYLVEKLRDVYYPDPTNGSAVKDGNVALLTNLYSASFTLHGFGLQADANSRDDSKNSFLFRFSVHDAFNLLPTKYEGAAHTDDVCYMFHCHIYDASGVYSKHLEQQDKSYELIMRSVDIVSNFARIGDPSIVGDTPFKSSKSSNEIYCQEVSNELKTSVTYDIKEQLHHNLWLEIVDTFNSLNITQPWM